VRCWILVEKMAWRSFSELEEDALCTVLWATDRAGKYMTDALSDAGELPQTDDMNI
jgi:hypothetical protein